MVTLSLILCSRNDRYMGDSRWRLETTLNFAGERIKERGLEHEVEIIVADWGSAVPLADVVRLRPAAASLTSFLRIPAGLAAELQGDSPFPEVLALNAAARRARGQFIGRVDQDTLVGSRFFDTFWRFLDRESALASTLLYANRRRVPYRLASQCPSWQHVDRFVRTFGTRLTVECEPGRPFWTTWVGIWLAHRDRWIECGGYDERLVYYNWMEVDMIRRLRQLGRHVVDLGALTSYDFYHLEHVAPGPRPFRHAKKNRDIDLNAPVEAVNPNGESWGLVAHSLPVEQARVQDTVESPAESFGGLVASTAMRSAIDRSTEFVSHQVQRVTKRLARVLVSPDTGTETARSA